MKAMALSSFGGPESFELSQVPKPIPQSGQVLVRVYARSNHWITSFGAATMLRGFTTALGTNRACPATGFRMAVINAQDLH